MSKIDASWEDKDAHAEWMLSSDCHCCFTHFAAYREKDYNSLYVGTVCSNGPYWETWRAKIKVAWAALRGKLLGHDLEFDTKKSASDFIEEFKKAMDWTFKEDESG